MYHYENVDDQICHKKMFIRKKMLGNKNVIIISPYGLERSLEVGHMALVVLVHLLSNDHLLS